MDIVLEVTDTVLFDRLYASIFPGSCIPAAFNVNTNRYFPLQPSEWACRTSWGREDVSRQALSLFLLTWAFGLIMYFVNCTLSYHFVFDKRALSHPRFLPNQIHREIKQALFAMPVMAALTVPFFLAEVRGYAKLYDSVQQAPFPLYTYLQYPFFVACTDCGVYWIHRWKHHPSVYKWLHKPHHQWIVPTPFASYAFHPLDGWLQSVPYHIFPFIFPLQKMAYLALFGFVTIWTVLIHDGEYLTNSPVINGSACHTMHHLYFRYNYGQFTTLWDRLGGSYRKANEELFDSTLKMGQEEWSKQANGIENELRRIGDQAELKRRTWAHKN